MSLLRISILAALLIVALFMGLVQGMDASPERATPAYRFGNTGPISADAAEDAARTSAARSIPDATVGVALDRSGLPLADETLAITGSDSPRSDSLADDAAQVSATASSSSASQSIPMVPDVVAPGADTTMPPATTAVPATSAAPDGRRTVDGTVDPNGNPLGHSLPTPAPIGSK